MQTDKDFEDFFRERFNGLEETPPLDGWEKISQGIKPPRTYYREMAAAILLCLVATCIFLGIKQQPPVPEGAALAQNARVHAAETPAHLPAPATSPQPALNPAAGTIARNFKTQRATETETVTPQPAPAGRVSENSTTLTRAPKTKNKHLLAGIAAIKEEKPTQKPETSSETAAPAVAMAAGTTRTRVLLPEKSYPLEAGKSAATVETTPENAMVSTRQTQPAAAAGSANPENEQAKINGQQPILENGIAVAQALVTKTDSVALPAIPALPADSLNPNNQVAEATEKPATTGKFAVSLHFTPGVIARRLIANPNDASYLFFSQEKGNGNSSDLGFDLNAALNYQISPKTKLDAGFAYTRLRSTVQYQVTDGHLGLQTRVVDPGAQAAQVNVSYAYHNEEFRSEFAYGGVRIGLTQELLQTEALTVFASAGAGLNALVSQKSQVVSRERPGLEQTETTGAGNALHTVNSHVYLQAGVARELLPRVSLLVAPAVTYYLNSTLRKQQLFELKPYTFGLNFGVRYQF